MKRSANKPRCAACDFELGIAGSLHELPATFLFGETCAECDAAFRTVCQIRPGHKVVRCESGHVFHAIEKLVQPCPDCGADMFIESSRWNGTYVYRCDKSRAHVKIEGRADEIPKGEGDVSNA